MTKGVEGLRVWQEARKLAGQIYQLTKCFPDEEKYNFTSHLRRAGVSVMSNIAEGQGRYSRKDFVRFLYLARGSLYEVQSLVILANDLGYLDKVNKDALLLGTDTVGPMLNALIAAQQEAYEVREEGWQLDPSFYEEQGTRN